jgi:putative two-component system response regulator
VVDDEAAIVRLLARALNGAGYVNVEGFTEPEKVPAYLDRSAPDLVVLDLRMPHLDGFAILKDISQRLPQDTFLPVLVVSGMSDADTKVRAMREGAKDFLAKPVDLNEFLARVHSLLDTRFLNLRLNETRSTLQELLQRRTTELRQAHLEALERLGKVAEIRDDPTGQHPSRIGRLSAMIAQELHLPQEEVESIMRAAPLHDLGKVAIQDHILLKSGGLAAEEREIIREHVLFGSDLLSGGKSEIMQMAQQIALHHHERWDGQGYPHGLNGSDIPLVARIVAVADSFDALTHPRPYKEAWSIPEALAELQRERGWQFDPDVVDALVRVQRQGALANA